jgi:STE24 endopeptidase
MNPFLLLILVVLIARYVLELVADRLNVQHIAEELPDEFVGVYDAERYRKSQQYLKEKTSFGLWADTVNTAFVIVMILLGGFNLVDTAARGISAAMIPAGLLFVAILMVLGWLLNLPFRLYNIFVIEEKYGFNRTTPRTFVLDTIKNMFLTVLLGAPILAAILWFFDETGSTAWIYCWAAVAVFQLFVAFILPTVILPIFNKFTPLAEGELRTSIAEYARKQKFHMKGIFEMDGSKRSTKTNAFFAGFGKSRRIVLFDTLIAKHTVGELVAIIAHEMGHYRKKHVLMRVLRSFVTLAIMFYLMSLLIRSQDLFDAFRMDVPSIYAGLVFFGFVYTPIRVVLSVLEHRTARRQEYAADAFAVETTDDAESMITALKKLSVDNLSNLTPHPLKVALDYTHPPVLQRIRALRAQGR